MPDLDKVKLSKHGLELSQLSLWPLWSACSHLDADPYGDPWCACPCGMFGDDVVIYWDEFVVAPWHDDVGNSNAT